jgi:AraC-like DNA-binding protein
MSLASATLDGFSAAPAGKYFAGATFAHFCVRADFWGVLLWDRPTSEDMSLLVRSLLLELTETAAPHASLVDARRLGGVDVTAFSVLDAYVRDHREELAAKVKRLALLRPEGMAGAVVAGFFEVLPKPYPVELFSDADEAMAWLGVDEANIALCDELHAAATGIAPVVRSLRAVLDDRLTTITLAEAARTMGVSERTLQRRLREAGTTFIDEHNEARMRLARRLLIDSDEPVTHIALEVGCSTPQHFSALFRKHTGMTPSAWRRSQRPNDDA